MKTPVTVTRVAETDSSTPASRCLWAKYIVKKDGFCYPDWQRIGDLIEKNLAETKCSAAWRQATIDWLVQIQKGLGSPYQIHETPNFFLLTSASTKRLQEIADFYEQALSFVLQTLTGVARDEGYGKHVVLMFDQIDQYYRYIAPFYPEGEYPMSGGVFLGNSGYDHFAFPTFEFASYRGVLVHELTHQCLAHLPLPSWLNEAVAMRLENTLAGSRPFFMDQELYERHAAHWNECTIQEYWSGHSFEIPGDSNELSYSLSELLLKRIEEDIQPKREDLLRFISHADDQDAGETACAEIFKISLADLIRGFLGEGNWRPQPNLW